MFPSKRVMVPEKFLERSFGRFFKSGLKQDKREGDTTKSPLQKDVCFGARVLVKKYKTEELHV